MNEIIFKFIHLPRLTKQLIMVMVDIAVLFFALWISFSMRLDEFYIPEKSAVWLLLIPPFIAVPIFIRFGLYRAIVRYIGFKALWTIIKAVTLYAVIWAALVFLSGATGIPRSVTFINWLAAIILIGGSRMIARWWFAGIEITDPTQKKVKRNVLIYGAGNAGVQLANVLSYSKEFVPVGFIDDKKELYKKTINSLSVFAFQDISKLLIKYDVDEVFLALPSVSHTRRRRIIQLLEPFPVHVRTLPSMSEVADGKIKLEDIKEVDLEDLLGRDAVEPDEELYDACIKNKSVMVTGAGGSIGSELCRQIISRNPRCLVLFEQSEFNLYKIEQELISEINSRSLTITLIPVLGSVTNKKRISKVIELHSINTIYHAAAYKHVPLVEYNTVEGVRVNTVGTYSTAEAAVENNVETFILISTDKAVRPTNVMGASKRFAELVLQGLSQKQSTTHFSMVRFGNVLGSSGSVVPLFREQIKNGGPVTVTHQDIIRYFMTIPEASQLVIQAGAMSTISEDKGGDVFVLDMGEPVKISELATKLIHLMGFTVKDEKTPDGDIEIEYTGLRPGEKLYEELLIGNNATGTSHPRIMKAEEASYDWETTHKFLEKVALAISTNDIAGVREILTQVVKEYQPSESIADVLWNSEQSQAKNTSVVELSEYQSNPSSSKD